MNLFIEKHQELLTNLIDAKVDFIIIGGYSVIYHGYARSTGDVDIWLKPDNLNRPKLLEALSKMDFYEADLAEVATLDFTGYLVFSIWDDPEKVDFITRINLLNFDEAYQRKVTAEIDGVSIPFLHIEDLVRSKINTGRLKDKADIEELQKIQTERNSL